MSLLRPVAVDEKAAFWKMLADYLVEHAVMADPEGRYDPLDMPTFELYWSERHRRPSWILGDGEPAGLALVNDRYAPSGQPVDHGLVEFYVAPDRRRRGLGLDATAELFRSLPGQWELSVSRLNPGALAFWPKAIQAAGPTGWEEIAAADSVIHRFRIG